MLTRLSQVARGGIVPFFNDVFDALCKLSADSDPNVQARRSSLLYSRSRLPRLRRTRRTCWTGS
jgi:hypothetical protein